MAWNSDRQLTPYFVSTVATGIFRDEFDSDTGYESLSSISGWLENNVGLLNTQLYTAFSGSGTTDGDTALQATGTFKYEESDIFKQLYLVNYYKKKTRAVIENHATLFKRTIVTNPLLPNGELIVRYQVEIRTSL